MTGALALACFVKAYGVVFLGLPRSEAGARAHESGWLMRAPMVVLSLACVAIGLAPAWFWPFLDRASSAWQPAWRAGPAPAPLAALGGFHLSLALLAVFAASGLWLRVRRNGLERAVTWDCGYAAPTARMQYTAGSFAAIITGWFAWILRPQRHAHSPAGPFPARSSFEEHTPETVLARVVEPAGSAIMRVVAAVRRLQHGRIQAYVLYVLIGVLGLAVLAVAGGGR
jgi:hydrogenase-4 component B